MLAQTVGVSMQIDNLASCSRDQWLRRPASQPNYFALSGSGGASLIGVDGVSLSGRVAIQDQPGQGQANGALKIPSIDFWPAHVESGCLGQCGWV